MVRYTLSPYILNRWHSILISYSYLGGPHSNYVAGLYKDPMILNALGYSVLMINYRGSSGYGQDSIDCLPGNLKAPSFVDINTTR